MKLSLLQRLLSPLIPLILVATLVAAIAYRSLGGGNDDLMKAIQVLEQGFQAQYYASEMSDAMKGYLLNPANKSELQRKLDADSKLQGLLREVRGTIQSKEMLATLERLGEADDKELNPFEEEIVRMVDAGNTKEALARFHREYGAKRANYDAALRRLVDLGKTIAISEAANIRENMSRAFVLIVASLTMGMLAIAAVLVWIALSLSRKLGALTERFHEEAGSVNSASRQILEASQSLAQAVSEQSAALQETVSSVEEINAMVARNASNAQKSQETVVASRQTFEDGKVSVQAMVSSMSEIQQGNERIVSQIEKNNSEIADIVTVISEIGSKTKVINDIVFQTKLLSFNASVEAARAGEHGKGFAVVAEEVGNLAQMSGNAAKEIAAMLEGSVQKVQELMTRRSSEASELVAATKRTIATGSESTRRCSEAFDSVMKDAEQVGGIMGEIATASQEQAQGLAEVTKAVGQLDQVTQQNNTVAQRSNNLAETLLKQAQSLRFMAEELKATVQGATSSEGSPAPVKSRPDPAPARPVATGPARVSAPAPKEAPKKARPQPAPQTSATGQGAVPSADDHRFIDL
ncbi:MAG: methyl-accepting chemotaxis protein [Oligoflexia bacterium]|nr:methyl-accepting chemotaxis protein [Oligoflexia bacterium]